MWNTIRGYLAGRDGVLALILLIGLTFGGIFPTFANGIVSAVEKFGAAFAKRTNLAIISIALAAILIRVSLLWLIPVPVPRIHDEFSYLLLADTLAHGRLANPPHPMHLFLDTFHVNQFPFYVSKYPPAQGAVLALGQILGNPWIGVLLSVAAMCAAVLWMLQGWLPARWALLGGILVLLRLGIFSYWMNSYWGGAVPAIGGALVVGAMPRILSSWRARDSLILGFGAAILMNSRPLEGLLVCMPVAFGLLIGYIRPVSRPSTAVILRNLVLPGGLLAAASGSFFCYYNWRTTGDALVVPHLVNERTYFSAPHLLWGKVRPPIHYENPQFEAFYNGWTREQFMIRRSHFFMHISLTTLKFFQVFMWPELFVPLLALPWLLRDRSFRFLIVVTAIGISGFWLNAYFQPHYAAPIMAVAFAIVVQAIRHMRVWECAGRPIGLGLSRMTVIFAIVFAPFHRYGLTDVAGPIAIDYRPTLESQLEAEPGKHLVLVRYSPKHDTRYEWVYNKADIDGSKVVWAREIPGVDNKPLLNYFQGRHIWLVEAEASPPRLRPYTP